MLGSIRAEFLKLFTTRTWWGMAIAVFVAGAGFAALVAWALHSGAAEGAGGSPIVLDDAAMARNVYTGGIQISYLLTLVIGVLSVGSEYRHKTITSTFLATPVRPKVMAAKVVSLLGIGGLYGIIALVGSVSVGAFMLSRYDVPAFPDSSVWRTLALSLLVLGLWALIGLGAGILIPNQLAALLVSVGVAWIVEPVLGLILVLQSWGPTFAKFLPGSASQAVLGGLDVAGGQQILSWWAGALVLAGYAAVMASVGTALTVRRDVA
jgi:hypothetical protein